MKGKSWAALILAIFLIIVGVVATTTDIRVGKDPTDPKQPRFAYTALVKRIKQGLDLKGGVLIIYEAQAEKVTDEQMQTSISIIERRLAEKRYFDATVTRQGEKQIRVEIPGIKDTQQAIDEIGRTAKLTFEDPQGNVVVDGKDVVDAKYAFGPTAQNRPSEPYVTLKFNAQAQKAFADATGRVAGAEDPTQRYIAIKLDEQPVSMPTVSGRIDTDTAIISGNFTDEAAHNLANLIRGGALPFKLDPVRNSEIGAKLGADALRTSILAGAIGIAFVLIFMIALYRVAGLCADLALVAYTAIVLGILGSLGMTLTLPGIAGIILSVGMAVDANVIIFERLKEELRSGKTVRAALDSAFKRAFTAIIDGNVTTLIASVVLWTLGSAQIQGFAITLFVGVLVSMFTALVITRFIIKHVVNLVGNNPKLYTYGVGK